MRSSFRVTLLMLTLGACAGDVGEALDDESTEIASSPSNLEASCTSFSALNGAHVQAGRAYATTRYVYFRRVTTYYARGSNERLGTSASVSTTLYEVASGSYSLSPTDCGGAARSDAGVGATDASAPTPIADASALQDAALRADASTPADAGARASSGCGLTPPSSGSGKSVVVNGANRTYVLSVPASYDRTRAYPLIFAFHGLGGSGAQAQLYFGLAQATQGQAVIVYPDATGSSRAWGITGSGAAIDVAFFDELLRTLSSSLCIDQNRVFAAGHSMGGYFSNTLGCARGNTLRAIAPVAGGGPYVSCDSGKVAAWVMAATDDPTVSYTAGQSSRDHWLRTNGCGSSSRPVGPGACVAYDGCDAQHPVHWCLESSGGHAWPSYAGQAIWSFFKAL